MKLNVIHWQDGRIEVDGEYLDHVVQCETEEEFEKFQGSDNFACEYKGETYVKLKVNENDYDLFTLAEANGRHFPADKGGWTTFHRLVTDVDGCLEPVGGVDFDGYRKSSLYEKAFALLHDKYATGDEIDEDDANDAISEAESEEKSDEDEQAA